jgi:hypothetical protein
MVINITIYIAVDNITVFVEYFLITAKQTISIFIIWIINISIFTNISYINFKI